MNRSPFTSFFHQLLEEVSEQAANETESTEDNLYFCPGIINFLFNNYLAIFPLWSGILLGSVKRYASDNNTVDTKSRPEKTGNANCHVENWFGIIKQSIIKTKMCSTRNICQENVSCRSYNTQKMRCMVSVRICLIVLQLF